MLLSSKAWAIADPEGINVRTVSEHRRAAIVNWLVAEKGVGVFAETTDEAIERLWRQLCGASEVMEVTVQRHI